MIHLYHRENSYVFGIGKRKRYKCCIYRFWHDTNALCPLMSLHKTPAHRPWEAASWRCFGAAIVRRGVKRTRNNRPAAFGHWRAGIHAEPAVYADDMVSKRGTLSSTACSSGSIRFHGRTDGARCAVARRRLRNLGQRSPDVILKMGAKKFFIARGILASTDTIFIARCRSFTMSFRRHFDRRALVCSSKTAATVVRASGGSRSCLLPRAKAQSFASCRRLGAACPKTCRLPIS